MERSLRVIVVGCLQRCPSAAASCGAHSLVRLDGGVARGAAADFLLFDSSRRVLHDSTRFVMPEDAYKNRAGHQEHARKRAALRRKSTPLAFRDTI